MGGPFTVPGPVEIVAHRGFSARAPENTMAALDLALRAGADAVEFDLHSASDGTPFLFHDRTLDRTTNGSGPISRRSPVELADLDAGSWFAHEFMGEPIPRLEAALASLRGRVGRIYAEIKGYGDLPDVDRIWELVQRADMLLDTVFISMDWTALDRIRDRDPDARIGYIVQYPSRIDAALERAAGDERVMLDFDAKILLADPAVASRAHTRSVELACWTVNEVDDAQRLYEMGVPRITTNEVDLMISWKGGL